MAVTPEAVEARTQEIGRAILEGAEEYRPRAAERVEDWLLTHAVADERFRTRLLRYLDVLASLDYEGADEQAKRLAAEYFDADFPGLPRVLRWLVRAGRNPALPAALVADVMRRSAEVFARRFITAPGEASLHEVIAVLDRLGRWPSFDLLGEAVLSEVEAEAYEAGYLRLIERVGRLPASVDLTRAGVPALQVSVKLSSLTHHFTPVDFEGSIGRVLPALGRIAAAARVAGVGVTVDAEQYEVRDLAWAAFKRAFGRGSEHSDWTGAGMVVQGYLRDSLEHGEAVIAFAHERETPFQVRLVKGAYWDYETIVAQANRWPSPVFGQKSSTDARFERLVDRLVPEHRVLRLAVGSHNPRSHAYAAAVAEARDLPPGAIEHQTLHRTAEGVSRALTEQGWDARDYVPVGELLPGMAYLVRRILENSSQAGFLMRSRQGATAEEVLRAPSSLDDPADVVPLAGTFQPSPVAAWHDASFRHGFEAALRETRARWGERLPLDARIGAGTPVEVRSPSYPGGEVVGAAEFSDASQVARAVQVAAGSTWWRRPVVERADVLRRAAAHLEARGHELASWVVHEGGRDRDGAWGEVTEAADFLRLYAAAAERLVARLEGRIAHRGVVAVIPPWNFSLAISCGMTAAALACGNAVILKPSKQTPLIARRLVDVLHQAGVPPDALLWLPGEGSSVGAALVESPDVDMVAFTGSRAVGVWMHEAVAKVERGTRPPKALTAELGGKNPVIVFADADLDETVAGILHSAFGHANQKCSAASRVLVARPIYARLRERLADAASSYVVGRADEASTQVNPIIDAEAMRRPTDAAALARDEGTVIVDRFAPPPGTQEPGPLIVEIEASRHLATRTATEELFGPILVLTPFDDEEEAYRLANGTGYGLTSGVFSRSPEAIARAAAAIEAGHVYVNRATTAARPGIEPFGGMWLSGTGPKVGQGDYLWAFVRRTDAPGDDTAIEGDGEAPDLDPGAWEAPLEARIEAVERAIALLADEGERIANDLYAATQAARRELAPEPTLPVAGQRTESRYDTPRGHGLVRARGHRAGWWLAAPLLAGNRVTVVDSPALDRAVQALWAAGVPTDVLRTLEGGAERLVAVAASAAVAFAAVDAPPFASLARALGPTAQGQTWLKALVSPLDGSQPWESGFVRRFTWPKVVAVRTLRHGADLDLTAEETR